MFNLKKTLLVAGILTTMSIVAFAAENTTQTTEAAKSVPATRITDTQEPTVCPQNQNCRQGYYKHHQESKEQRLKDAKKAMAKLSEEEREEVRDFMQTERKHMQKVREKLAKMTPEQREAIYANMRLHYKTWHKFANDKQHHHHNF